MILQNVSELGVLPKSSKTSYTYLIWPMQFCIKNLNSRCISDSGRLLGRAEPISVGHPPIDPTMWRAVEDITQGFLTE